VGFEVWADFVSYERVATVSLHCKSWLLLAKPCHCGVRNNRRRWVGQNHRNRYHFLV